MGAVGANCELELKQKLRRIVPFGVVRASQLSADLAEFARPVGHRERAPQIVERRVLCSLGSIEPQAGVPPASELVIAGHVETVAALQTSRLIAAADDKFRSTDERVIYG